MLISGTLTPLALFGRLIDSFVLGVLTPLTAVCVIPLYPGFVAYLSRATGEGTTGGEAGPSIALLGSLIGLGVLSFMTVLGLVFTTVLQVSLTNVIGVVSPAAFVALGLFGLVLLADLDFRQLFPSVEPPRTRYPTLSAFGYGFFFGAIVIPCNPGFVAVFFARAFLFRDPASSLLNFLAFGLGIVFPLFALAVVSDRYSSRVVGVITRYESSINRTTGLVMLAIAAYYLVAVFRVVSL